MTNQQIPRTTEIAPISSTDDGGPSSRRIKVTKLLRQSGLAWVLIILVAAGAASSPAFLTTGNLINVAREASLIGIVGIGVTFVILTAGIDLSVGSIVGVVAVSTGLMLSHGFPIPLAVLLGLLLGALLGALNGLGVVVGNIPAFVMTLALLTAGRGVALSLSGGQPILLGDAGNSFAALGNGSFAGIPNPAWIFVIMLLVAAFVLRYTSFGRCVYAVGDNAEAARLAGINTSMVIFSVYVISGLLAAVTAVIYVSRLTTGDPSLGTGLELVAITTVVIGGTSLFGGEGGVSGTLVGAILLATLANYLNLVGVSPFTQQIVQGAVLALAVLLDGLQRRRRT